jgi:hypothetical protein
VAAPNRLRKAVGCKKLTTEYTPRPVGRIQNSKFKFPDQKSLRAAKDLGDSSTKSAERIFAAREEKQILRFAQDDMSF